MFAMKSKVPQKQLNRGEAACVNEAKKNVFAIVSTCDARFGRNAGTVYDC